ncbi:MAG: glutathione S-transferase family protein [Hyphomonadaceae bacterium]|nr:glutathione S-transferase family protein [Hyphomonadaceae bacterium]
MKLWYSPRTRAFTALWMLEESGLPYTLQRVRIDGPEPDPALRAVNPMGKLPALEDGDAKFGETAAVLLYVADKAGAAKNLAPAADDPARGRFLQLLMFSATCMEPAVMERMRGGAANAVQMGWGDYARVERVLLEAIVPDAWLTGADFTAADLYIASTLSFLMGFNMMDKHPAFEAFTARAQARDAYKRAAAVEAAG